MNPLAEELNQLIKDGNKCVYELLSDLGKSMFYPKGILSQSAEANEKAHRFNATIGIATENNQPMHLNHIQETLSDYSPSDLYPYAPPQGKEPLRKAWRDKLLRENPSLNEKAFGMPIVTNALTHGLSIVADLFVNAGDPIVLPDKFWGNYNLTFAVRRGARFATFPLFSTEQSFNVLGLKQQLLAQQEHNKAIVLLNFPNNPTGYTPGQAEVDEIVSVIKEVAETGMKLVVVTDDAYFQLFYEDSIQESIFGRLANIHSNVLAVKVDGATKEEFVWGFRVGFITYASESENVLHALEEKTKGIIRATISSSPHPSQSFILKSLQSERFELEKREKFAVLKSRAHKVKAVLNSGKYDDAWSYYPFNSGYFMCLSVKGVNAEKLRLHLLHEYGVGTISINETDLRIAFSSVDEEDIEKLFDLIYQGVKELQNEDC